MASVSRPFNVFNGCYIRVNESLCCLWSEKSCSFINEALLLRREVLVILISLRYHRVDAGLSQFMFSCRLTIGKTKNTLTFPSLALKLLHFSDPKVFLFWIWTYTFSCLENWQLHKISRYGSKSSICIAFCRVDDSSLGLYTCNPTLSVSQPPRRSFLPYLDISWHSDCRHLISTGILCWDSQTSSIWMGKV